MKVSIRMHRLADGREVLRCKEAVCSYCEDRREALRCRLRTDIALVFDKDVEQDEPQETPKDKT